MFRWEPEGRYCHRLCTAIAPFWFSTEHLWTVITPFWLSTDDMHCFNAFLILCFNHSSFCQSPNQYKSSVESQKGAIKIQRCSVENQKGAINIQRCSVENQKGAINIQRCSVENQKGAIAVQSLFILVIAPFWFSTKHLWIVIAPFWLSTDEMVYEIWLTVFCTNQF